MFISSSNHANRSSRNAIRLLLAASLVVTGFAGSGRAAEAPDPVAPYRGLGAWIDIYDDYQWDHPARTVRRLKRLGVKTLFLQTGNYNSTEAVYRSARTNDFIHAAHARGLEIVAWYLPGFVRPREDLSRSLQAIRYETPRKQRFDGFGLDIEADLEPSIGVRKSRMLDLSRRLRTRARKGYSLGAIIPSPTGMAQEAGYWGALSDFPFRTLSNIYDVMVPMSYFTYHTDGFAEARNYMTFSIRAIRRYSEKPRVPIHPIGGLAGFSDPRETDGYVHAVRKTGVLGGSVYDYATTSNADWRQLSRIQAAGDAARCRDDCGPRPSRRDKQASERPDDRRVPRWIASIVRPEAVRPKPKPQDRSEAARKSGRRARRDPRGRAKGPRSRPGARGQTRGHGADRIGARGLRGRSDRRGGPARPRGLSAPLRRVRH